MRRGDERKQDGRGGEEDGKEKRGEERSQLLSSSPDSCPLVANRDDKHTPNGAQQTE